MISGSYLTFRLFRGRAALDEDLFDLVAGADRDGAFVHDDAPLHLIAQRPDKSSFVTSPAALHLTQIRRPVLARRRGKSKEDRLGLCDALGQVGREVEAALLADPIEILL